MTIDKVNIRIYQTKETILTEPIVRDVWLLQVMLMRKSYYKPNRIGIYTINKIKAFFFAIHNSFFVHWETSMHSQIATKLHIFFLSWLSLIKNWIDFFVVLLACKSVDRSTFCMKRLLQKMCLGPRFYTHIKQK